jgi:hypothetical protein
VGPGFRRDAGVNKSITGRLRVLLGLTDTENMIPAKAGIHRGNIANADQWVPAFAGT